MLQGIAKFYVDGGIWMHPIVFCSVFAIAIAVERFYALTFKYNINAEALAAQVQKLVMANNIDRAIKLCNTIPTGALPRVLKGALTRANKGPIEITDAVEVATVEVLRDVNKRTEILPNVANIATLLGLFGTVIGLIEAFAAVALAPPDMKSTLLTQALSVALNTTAMGLVVAIPTLGVYVFLKATTQKIVDDLDLYGLKLMQLLVARTRTPGAGEAAAS